jgi:signal transduction histidine kinase
MFKGKRILTVDDSITIRSFLKRLLSEQGALVDVATTGEEALTLCAQSHRYDLIILDLLLPDTDGIDVLRRIRATNEESAIIMLTGVGGVKSAITAVNNGADGYIEKHDINIGGDHTEFFYALDQGLQHREGIVAQAQLKQAHADFYSMVTHDMRNPAAATGMALDLLLEVGAENLTPAQIDLLSVAKEASHILLCLINDYLDFTKIDAGYLKLDLQETNLCEVLEAGVRYARVQARTKGQTLTVDCPYDCLPAVVDSERLRQVVDNLVSNAVKYTPERGIIRVQLRAAEQEALLSVSDTGQGISQAQMQVLFSKYQRLPGETTRRIRGTGLGLFIVKQTVELHGGTVSVESEGIPGKGSTFSVRIPLSPGQ